VRLVGYLKRSLHAGEFQHEICGTADINTKFSTEREKCILYESNTLTDALWQILLVNYTLPNGTENEHISYPTNEIKCLSHVGRN
jgi:hypothetical protein